MSSSTYRYLDIDSTYRNRGLWPNPAEFVIPVSYGPGGSQNVFSALDPIADGIPSIVSTTQAGSTATQIVLNVSSSSIDNFYVNQILQIGTEYRTIISYTASTQTATVNSAFTGAPGPGTTYYIRQAIPTFSSVLGAGSTQTVVNLGGAASAVNNTYTGSYIYFLSGPDIGQSALITNYVGSTKLATLAKPLTAAPAAGNSYDIIAYSNDNSQPLFYSGTTGFSNAVCYSIELLHLLVPNQTLISGYGGTFANYPYVYLQLSNNGAGNSLFEFYSNNPNAQQALFKVPIGCKPTTESFINLKDTKEIQVVKLKVDQALKFRVYLPDGSPIIFDTDDTASPLSPNPLLQISATFAIRRIQSDITK